MLPGFISGLAALCTATFISPAAFAAEPTASYTPFNHIARYNFTWNNVPIGFLAMQATETGDNYEMKTVIRAQGLAQVVSKHKSGTTVRGTLDKSHVPHPSHYETSFETRGKGRDIKLDYDSKGTITAESNLPPENRDKRPEVKADLKDGALDPLSAAFETRRLIANWRAGDNETKFKMRLYDGRRAMYIIFTVVGKETIRVGKEAYAAVHINGRREAIAGFTNNELKRIPDEEPEVDLYISDDDKMVPLYLKAKAVLGTVYANLAKTCNTAAECGM